jgi:hypothetical protein
MKRRRAVVVSGLVAGAMVLGGAGAVLAGTTPGLFGRSEGVASPKYNMTMSGYGAPGMMDTPGAGGMMGTPSPGGTPGPGGMMGNGGSSGMWSSCYPSGMMSGANGSNAQGKTLTLAQAQQRVQRYVAGYGTTTLAIDEVMEFQQNFYAIVKDKATGHGAFEVLVNKTTGAVFPEYGPAMMWNTQYGMMRGMRGYQPSSGSMTIAPTQATRMATQWLYQNQPGTTTETPEQFPGYYTVHILKNGRVTGMLSVNGYSGQVWYHTWHGALIQMKDLHA